MRKGFCDGCGKELGPGKLRRDYMGNYIDYCLECQAKADKLKEWLDNYDKEQEIIRDKMYKAKKREMFS